MKWGKVINLIVFLTIIAIVILALVLPRFTKYHLPILFSKKEINKKVIGKKIQSKAVQLKSFAKDKRYNTTYAFIIDMSEQSGLKRFYVYHFGLDTIINSGLVAHGSCNTTFLENASFNNKVGCGCSAYGKYEIGYAYIGNFGKAYKLIGLEASNNNAFERNIVLHGYHCVPNETTYPQPICNSLGCPMVSPKFFNDLDIYIKQSSKPILLWILDDWPVND